MNKKVLIFVGIVFISLVIVVSANQIRHKASPTWLYSMVTTMKYMNRYVPWIAKPIVNYIAENEVIACGLMLPGEKDPVIIFNPQAQKSHTFTVLKNGKREERAMGDRKAYVGDLVVYHTTPGAKKGEVYQIAAKKNNSDEPVFSPKISMKMNTEYDDSLLNMQRLEDGHLRFNWKEGSKKYQGMIYFLTFADAEGNGLFGIYTRETRLNYPSMKEVSLYIPGTQDAFDPGKQYTAKLLIVDYQGWVPAIDSVSFRF